MSNFLQICQKTQRQSGLQGVTISTVTGQVSKMAKMVEWVADAYDDICREIGDWAFLLTTVDDNLASGTDSYIPSDFSITAFSRWNEGEIYLNPGTSSYSRLSPKDHHAFRTGALGLGAAKSGKPTTITFHGEESFTVWPNPDANYAIRLSYYTHPARLASDSDTLLIPARFEQVVVERAKMYIAEHEEDREMFQSAAGEYARLMNQLKSRYAPGRVGSDVSEQSLRVEVV